MSLKLWLHTKESWSAARLRCGVHDIGNQQQLQQGNGRGAGEMSALSVAMAMMELSQTLAMARSLRAKRG
jgi:hypothetical protein